MSPGYPSYIADALDGQWQLERRRPHAVSDSDPAAVWFSPVVPPVHPDDVMVRYVIEYDLDVEHSILHVQPKSAIGRDDFVNLAKVVDPHIDATGGLAGLIVEAAGFPGWGSFAAMVNQFRFVRDHHKRIKRIAVVTDSHFGDVAEHFTSHFVSAEIRHFPAGQIEQARQWIITGS
jgi:SpoIIAA-like